MFPCIYFSTPARHSFFCHLLALALPPNKKSVPVVFGLAHKELMIKPAQGVTTGREYNKLEGDRNEKRWDAYKKREESGKTNDELHL